MSIPISKTIAEIKPSGIRKFFDIVSEMKDAISLGVGEPDFDTPWHIRDEGIYAFEKGKTFYANFGKNLDNFIKPWYAHNIGLVKTNRAPIQRLCRCVFVCLMPAVLKCNGIFGNVYIF